MGKQVKLVDPRGRIIHKLRVQLTDACNFRCFYCIPPQAKFMPPDELLSTKELLAICSNLVDLGINEIRISGGEPLLRKDFDDIIEGLSRHSLLRFGMTTNGYFLSDKLESLKKTQCRHINISLDSLNRDTYNKITRTRYFDSVYKAVLKAKAYGFHVKVNVVILKGINEHEVFDFIDFSAREKIEIRFLELMRIGPLYRTHKDLFVPAKEMIERIESREQLYPQSVNCDSTSFNFRTSSGASIGFIASESQSFCDFCSRLRLTSKGKLRACIMSEAGINLRGIPKVKYPGILKSVLGMKPIERIDYTEQPMYQIGG